ncbi:mariner Mos1 transposase [Trichonephila clavipes]|nr:mariner Mos1 transposase [Trichonephila clavipes]
MACRSPASPRRKKVRAEKSCFKRMAHYIFDSQNIIHKEFLPEGRTLNAAWCIEILIRFIKRLRSVNPFHKTYPNTHSKVHEFCSLQCSLSHRQYRQTVPGKKGARMQIEHPPLYSTDFNPPNFFLFVRLKLALKGKRLDDTLNIQQNRPRTLNAIPKEDFLQSFQNIIADLRGA